MTNSPTPAEEVAARLAKYEEGLRETRNVAAALREAYGLWPETQYVIDRLCADLRAQAAELATLQAQRDRLVGALERLRDTAIWMFRAFAAGVAGKDVRERRYTKEAGDAWKKSAVADFEQALHEAVPRAALTNQPEHREESER